MARTTRAIGIRHDSPASGSISRNAPASISRDSLALISRNALASGSISRDAPASGSIGPSRTRRARGRATVRRGFTLFELMLAVALSGIVLGIVGFAINLHLKVLEERRSEIERAQLARAVLALVSKDLRNAVRYQEVDTSGVGSALDGALENLDLESLVEEAGGGGGEEGGEQQGGGQTGGGQGSGQGSGGGQGAGGLDLLGEAGEMDATMLEEEPLDIAANAAPSAVIGIYGNSYQLQVDVSRLPRVDQYDRILADASPTALQDVPSDVKTVAYYLAPETMEVDDPTVDSDQPVDVPATIGVGFGYGRGLVRRELDRSVTNWAIENGDTMRLQDSGEILAPEVVGLQFRYYDGMMWASQWDSEQMQRLPLAVEVTILLDSQDGSQVTEDMVAESALDPNSTTFYRIVVPILVAELSQEEEEKIEEELGF